MAVPVKAYLLFDPVARESGGCDGGASPFFHSATIELPATASRPGAPVPTALATCPRPAAPDDANSCAVEERAARVSASMENLVEVQRRDETLSQTRANEREGSRLTRKNGMRLDFEDVVAEGQTPSVLF